MLASASTVPAPSAALPPTEAAAAASVAADPASPSASVAVCRRPLVCDDRINHLTVVVAVLPVNLAIRTGTWLCHPSRQATRLPRDRTAAQHA